MRISAVLIFLSTILIGDVVVDLWHSSDHDDITIVDHLSEGENEIENEKEIDSKEETKIRSSFFHGNNFQISKWAFLTNGNQFFNYKNPCQELHSPPPKIS